MSNNLFFINYSLLHQGILELKVRPQGRTWDKSSTSLYDLEKICGKHNLKLEPQSRDQTLLISTFFEYSLKHQGISLSFSILFCRMTYHQLLFKTLVDSTTFLNENNSIFHNVGIIFRESCHYPPLALQNALKESLDGFFHFLFLPCLDLLIYEA